MPSAIPCNCRRVVGRSYPGQHRTASAGEFRPVKSWRWDCPSCGLYRKRRLVEMCGAASVTRILTLTFAQPHAADPGTLPAEWKVPATFENCDPESHVYLHRQSMTWRWRRVSTCASCCRHVSRLLSLFRKRLRRLWPEAQYLQVKEDHKSGALHLHLAVTGVPASITRTSSAGLKVKAAWAEIGGGFVDVGRHGRDSGDKAGWYVGKYLAKRHDSTMSRGFRRWSRTADFAPEVLMRPRYDPDPDSWHDPGAPLVFGGWLHPDGTESGYRWWPKTELPEAPPPRLDPITAKCPQLRSVVADLDAWRASWVARRGPDSSPGVCCPPVPETAVQTFAFDDLVPLPARRPSARAVRFVR